MNTNDSVMIFTFSPVQPFIGEARRAADLYAGSHILVELAKAAAEILASNGQLIYPTGSAGDLPNKLVALVPLEKAGEIAESIKTKFLQTWKSIAGDSKQEFQRITRDTAGDEWQKIWERQVNFPWELFWAASALNRDGQENYRLAYEEADRAVEAQKRLRRFDQSCEPGIKDTLSGSRQALRSTEKDANEYWQEISKKTTAALLRPGGRERLDAVGLIKRFKPNLGGRVRPYSGFPSTSSIASAPFLEAALPHLKKHRRYIDILYGLGVFSVRTDESPWPFDGDFLYMETLCRERLEKDYQLKDFSDNLLKEARQELDNLHQSVGWRPSKYYGLMRLDGDGLGKMVTACLEEKDPQDAHRKLSGNIFNFADKVPGITDRYLGALVYNGGDDVMALVPLCYVHSLGLDLAEAFEAHTGGTASAGIAIVHHVSPLDAALSEAGKAEREAKDFPDKNNPQKNALCIKVHKRSSGIRTISSHWHKVKQNLDDTISIFRSKQLSTGFAYNLETATYALPMADEAFKMELLRLIERGRDRNHENAIEPAIWADRWVSWAQQLPGGTQDLAGWIRYAAFVAQGGEE